MEPLPAAARQPPPPPRPPAPPTTAGAEPSASDEPRDPWGEVNRAVVSALPERPVRVLDIGGRLSRVVLDARPLLRELVVLNPYPSKRDALARLGEDYRVEVIDAWTALEPIPTTPRFDLVLWRHWCPAHARAALLADAVTQLVPRGTFIDHVPVANPLIDGALAAVLADPMVEQLGVDLDVELAGLRDAGLVNLENRWSKPGGALVVGQAPPGR